MAAMVLMIAPALAKVMWVIAMGTGTDVAIEKCS